MFYITAHTVTQNQFANIDTECNFTNNDPFSVCTDPLGPFGLVGKAHEKKSPIVLLPNHLPTFENAKLSDKDFDYYLPEIIIADDLKRHTNSVCSTKSLLSDSESSQCTIWGGTSIFMIIMAVIFATLLLTLFTLVCIKIIV